MLLRFGAQNILSIYERQEFSFIASKLKGIENGLLKAEGQKFDILPASVVYGANASGKTNLAKAFSFLRNKVLYSHSRGDPQGDLERQPFALNPDAENKPTILDADFIVDGVRYHYGFEALDDHFKSEWLYSFPEGSRRKLFERTGNNVEFGSTMRGAKKTLTEFMRPNSLFLSTATQNDHEELSKVVSFFHASTFNSSVSVEQHLVNQTFKSDEIDSRTIEILNRIGTGVTSYRKSELGWPPEVKSFTRKLWTLTREQLGNTNELNDQSILDLEKNVAVELGHVSTDGETKYFSLARESSGTRRLLVLLNSVFIALDKGSFVIIDELDASLHTHAAEIILGLFCSPYTNKNGAQLLTTTHDTNLMVSKLLRRDQIWLAEKDPHGATHIFPLSDIKTRQSDNFEAGYLDGRYGAIPFSGATDLFFTELTK